MSARKEGLGADPTGSSDEEAAAAAKLSIEVELVMVLGKKTSYVAGEETEPGLTERDRPVFGPPNKLLFFVCGKLLLLLFEFRGEREGGDLGIRVGGERLPLSEEFPSAPESSRVGEATCWICERKEAGGGGSLEGSGGGGTSVGETA